MRPQIFRYDTDISVRYGYTDIWYRYYLKKSVSYQYTDTNIPHIAHTDTDSNSWSLLHTDTATDTVPHRFFIQIPILGIGIGISARTGYQSGVGEAHGGQEGDGRVCDGKEDCTWRENNEKC